MVDRRAIEHQELTQEMKIVMLINFLRESKTFTMTRFGNDCGTPACVAGHACYLATGTVIPNENNLIIGDTDDVARRWLELTDEQAAELFYPTGFAVRNYKATDVIECLENFLKTEKIEWREIEWP